MDKVCVNSWDEWFEMMGTAARLFERYERAVRAYLKGRREGERFGRAHRRGFWRKDAPVPQAHVNGIILFMLLGIIPGLVAGVLACRNAGRLDAATLVIAAFAGMVACGFARAVPVVVGHALRCRRLARAEDALAPYLTLIPQQFRNAQCATWFFDAHESYGYDAFEPAAREVERLMKATRDYVAVQAMIDVPYDGSGMRAVARGARPVHDEHAPNLPEDIGRHTRAGAADWRRDLSELIGMDDVKAQVRRLERRVAVHGGSGAAVIGGNNMVLMGPAGVGKTSVARVLCGMLADAGIIRENRIVEVEGGYLKSPYQGQTGKRVEAVCTWAEGGVLFVDEAYLLFDPDSHDAAGREATGVLLKYMEDHTQDLVVMLAGYTDDMERLIASNEGFRSRVRHQIRFKPYTASELGQICALFLRRADLSCEPGVIDIVARALGEAVDAPGFGGAREARNAADALIDIQSDRIAEHGGDAHVIARADARAWAASRTGEAKQTRREWLSTMGVDEKIVSAAELEGRTHMVDQTSERMLERLVGQASAKEELAAWKARTAMLGRAEGSANIALLGPAGVGKTTFAELVAATLFEAGRIAEPRVLDVTGDWFRANYVGQTGTRTEAAVQWSRGGVLFIDEAYLMVDAGSGGFGTEALGVLVNDMEKMDDLVVVVAGYDREMASLFDQNPGLASRISTHIHLGPYSVRELMLICQRMARARGFRLAPDVYRVLQAPVEARMGERDFGQARAMRRALDAMIGAHALRWSEDKTLNKHLLDTMDAAMALEKLGW